MELPSRGRLFTRGRDTVLTLSRTITRAVIERKHTDINMLLNIAAAMGDEVLGFMARILAMNSMESCYGADLDDFIYNRFGLTRKGAAPGYTYLRFTFPTSADTLVVPAGTVARTPTGVQLATSEDGLLVSGATQTGLVEARTLLAGADQQVAVGAVNQLVTRVAGAPSDISVLNPYASAGADEQETDGEFRARARAYFRSLGRGTARAIEAKALAHPGVRRATLVEFTDTLGMPSQYNQLVLADRFTEALVSSGAAPEYTAQADVLANSVLGSLSDTRTSGSPIEAMMAAIRLLAVRLQYGITPNFAVDETNLRRRVKGAALGYVNALAVGQSFEPDVLAAVVRGIGGVYAPSVTVTSPAVPVVARSLELIRTTAAMVNVQ